MSQIIGPADTNDPSEIYTSVRPDKKSAAETGQGTSSGAMLVGRAEGPRTEWLDTDRTETYQQVGPDGKLVTVERNLELGDSRIIAREA